MSKFTASDTIPSPKARLGKAALIYTYAHKSASSMLMAFDDAKARRHNARGILTDQEQDILRAALVMSCAGLDGALKQAIRNCIEHLLVKDDSVREGFEKFIRKRLTGEGDVLETGSGTRFLAKVLAESNPRARLIEEYINELTGGSLQSAAEVMRTVTALGMDPKGLGLDIDRMREIFKIRNKIIHELDVDLNAAKRKRKVRSQADLLDNTECILVSTRIILIALNEKL